MTYTYTQNKLLFSFFILTGLIYVRLFGFYTIKTEDMTPKLVPSPTFDLTEIKQRGKLIALTDNSSTSFYLYKGDSMGYEYDQLRAFANEIGVDLEMVVARNMDSIFNQLNNGEVDIIAANLTVTRERLEMVDFSDPLMLVPQVLVQRKPEGWEKMSRDELNTALIRNTTDLSGKSIAVRKGSSFYSRLKNLAEEIGEPIHIIEAPGHCETEELISKVAAGEIDYTIADENVALSNQTYFSNIDAETPISFPQKIAWAIRKDSPDLTKTLNDWIEKRKSSNENNIAYAKYFKKKKKYHSRNEGRFVSLKDGRISEYDELIKEYSTKINWDWQLLASLICQESRFSPTARSWAGANGLMQLVPATAKQYGLDTLDTTAEQSIEAGTSFILDLEEYWKKRIPNKDERLKFILASYNAGIGHVIDARNLAIKYGKDPDIWYDNVDYMLLQKSNPLIYNDPVVKFGYCRGHETYAYVKDILSRYERYKKLTAVKPDFVQN